MIKIAIATDGKKIHDSLDYENITLKECALVVYRLEQMKEELLAKEFKSEFEVREGDKDGGE